MTFDSVERKINRVLFCTSPLQVINARTAMDYNGAKEHCNDVVVIIHPLLNENSKSMINDFAKKMNFDKVIDLSGLIKKHPNSYLNSPGLQALGKLKKWPNSDQTFFYKISNFKKIVLNRINEYEELSKNIITLLQDEIGVIDEIFFRMKYANLDLLFINTQKKAIRYSIEDGFGDYIPSYWCLIAFNNYEIKHITRRLLISWSLFLASIIYKRSFKKSRDIFLKFGYFNNNSYSNLKIRKRIYVGDYFKKNILKLGKNFLQNNKIKVIILGTLQDARYRFNINREIEIYNCVVKQISHKYGIDANEIWYKPHPRLTYNDYKIKKEKLLCSSYNYNNSSIAEVELLNENLKAVYSMNSTTIYYSKKIFDVESYLIDIRNEGCHPASYKKAYYLAKKLNIDAVHI